MKRQHWVEVGWVVGGQAATALGTLAGVRLLTQWLPPAVFGTVSLCLGASTLILALGCTPLTQAAMHFFPTAARSGALSRLRAALRRELILVGVCGGLLLALALTFGKAGGSRRMSLIALLALLLLSDGWRSVNLSILNAGRRQRRYSVWSALDAWLRPLLATGFIVAFGASAEHVLLAYVLVSAGLLLCFSRHTWPKDAVAPGNAHLRANLWQYALPLVPLGVIGWINNLSDRYLIGATLGLDQAGIYAAMYGLASMPFMAAGGTIEQALRPVYQDAVAAGQRSRAQFLFRCWLFAVAAVCGAGVVLFSLCHASIAAALLGSRFRGESAIMPWIAAGYAIRSLAYVYERRCYAAGQTGTVLTIQASAAAVTLVATPIGAWGWGLRGAAMAAPLYFGIQLLVAMSLSRDPRHKGAGATGWVAG